jgi:hypothetical protein
MAIDLKPHVAKSQHQPRIGRDGKHRVEPSSGMVVSHTVDRQYEHDRHVQLGTTRKYSGGIDPRVGGQPKNEGQVPVHGGMHHVGRDGKLNLSVSATQVGSALHDAANLERDPLAKPPIGKRLSEPKITPGQRSRTSGPNDMHAQLGAAILHSALKGGGKTI